MTTALAITSPFPLFTDLNGAPLSGGSIYCGTVGLNPETNPATVYWDAAGTQPAAQPIPTINGFPARNGSPAAIYSVGDMSMTVRNKTGALVFTAMTSAGFSAAAAVLAKLADSTDAGLGDALVAVKTSEAGSVARTQHDKNNDLHSLKDVGAVGNGSTDDSIALMAAALTGKMYDGDGLTYKINGQFSQYSSLKLRNAVLDVSGINKPYGSGSPYAIFVGGTAGADSALTANALAMTNVLAVADASGFSAYGYVWVHSDTVWDTYNSSTVGFLAKVRSISGNNLTLCDYIPYDMTTAANAKAQPLTMTDGVVFEDVTFIGLFSATIFNSGSQYLEAVYLQYCQNARFTRCKFRDCNYAGIVLDRCVDTVVTDMDVDRAHAFGLAYGVVVSNGSSGTIVKGGNVNDVRHGVTHGGTSGVNRGTIVTDLVGTDMLDALVDAHSTCDGLLVANCRTTVGTLADGTSGHQGTGFISQGINWKLIGCTITDAYDNGALWQGLSQFSGAVDITGNSFISRNPVADAFSRTLVSLINNPGGAATTLGPATVIGNSSKGVAVGTTYSLYVEAKTGHIAGLTFSDNDFSQTSSSGSALQVVARSGFTIDKLRCLNNSLTSADTSRVALLNAIAANGITNVELSGNLLDGLGASDYAATLINCQNGKVGPNRAINLDATGGGVVYQFTTTTGIEVAHVFQGSLATDPANLPAGNSQTFAVTVTGARVGDRARAVFSLADTSIHWDATVTSNDTATVLQTNHGGGAVNLGAGTLTVYVDKQWN